MNQPFNAEPNTGRMGYRHEWEAVDERPLLYIAHPFWEDETERLTYEDAVEGHPRREGEGALSYAARISEVVVGTYAKAVRPMPPARTPKWRREQQLAKLRSQLPSGTEVIE